MAKATIVISAAGCGSRLGMNLPKSLVKVHDKPILEWQLTEMCTNEDNVKIVVGYRGDEVAQLARKYRPNIEVLRNEDWRTTKTAASLSIGARAIQGRVVSLDGDLLVNPRDFRELVHAQGDTIGVSDVKSSQPVRAEVVDQLQCTRLAYESASPFEWTGLVNFDPRRVAAGQGHVFEMLQCILPCSAQYVDCCEVDTIQDLELADREWKKFVTAREVAREQAA